MRVGLELPGLSKPSVFRLNVTSLATCPFSGEYDLKLFVFERKEWTEELRSSSLRLFDGFEDFLKAQYLPLELPSFLDETYLLHFGAGGSKLASSLFYIR